jgi:fructose-1,6-bisphosphatase/inositol monophosphatase family enzyme
MNIELIANATKKAAGFLIRDFREISYLKHSATGIKNFIAKSKHRTEEILVEEFQRYFPDHEIINVQKSNFAPQTESYVAFDPLEGELNMQNLLPFFAISIFVSTKKKNETIHSLMMEFPCLDKTCHAKTKSSTWIETYQDSFKKKAQISTSNKLTLIKNLDQSALNFIANNNIDLESLRVLGSNACATLLFAEGRAQGLLINNEDWLSNKIADLITLQSEGIKSANGLFNFYTSNKLSTKKVLSLAN